MKENKKQNWQTWYVPENENNTGFATSATVGVVNTILFALLIADNLRLPNGHVFKLAALGKKKFEHIAFLLQN